jgi:hypothetical protein
MFLFYLLTITIFFFSWKFFCWRCRRSVSLALARERERERGREERWLRTMLWSMGSSEKRPGCQGREETVVSGGFVVYAYVCTFLCRNVWKYCTLLFSIAIAGLKSKLFVSNTEKRIDLCPGCWHSFPCPLVNLRFRRNLTSFNIRYFRIIWTYLFLYNMREVWTFKILRF